MEPPPHPPDPWRSRLRRWWAILRGDRRARRAFWFRKVLRRLTPLVAVEGRGVTLLGETRDDTIACRLFEDGEWQFDELAEALEAIGARGEVFVDVGANLGPQTLYALDSGRFVRALALEPDPGLARLLRANLALNGLHERVEVVEAAAGAEVGTRTLEAPVVDPRSGRWNQGDHAVLPPGVPPRAGHPTREVPAIPLDLLLRERGLAPQDVGLVWVDVQGGEADVLAGARGLVEAGVPFACEFHPGLMRRLGRLDAFYREVRAFGQVQVLGEGRRFEPAGLPVLADERGLDLEVDLLLTSGEGGA